MEFIQNLVDSMSNPGDFVFDGLAGSSNTARTYMLLQLHLRLFVSDCGDDCRK